MGGGDPTVRRALPSLLEGVDVAVAMALRTTGMAGQNNSLLEYGQNIRLTTDFARDHGFARGLAVELDYMVGDAYHMVELDRGREQRIGTSLQRFAARAGCYLGVHAHEYDFPLVLDFGFFLLGGAERYSRGPLDAEEEKYLDGDGKGWYGTMHSGLSLAAGINIVRFVMSAGAVTAWNPASESDMVALQLQAGLKFDLE